MPEVLRVERDGVAAVLTLNRPHAGNSVNAELSRALEDALVNFKDDRSLRALIIRGEGGKFFCTGGDIKEYRALADRDAVEAVFGRTRRVLDRLERFALPTIAAVEGHALGGGAEIVLACDLAVAGVGARFGFPQVKLGIVPGWDGIERLVRRCGRRTALRLVASGEPLDAAAAKAAGIVDEVVPTGGALDGALRIAASFAAGAPLAVRQAKRLVDAAAGRGDSALRADAAAAFADLWFTADHREAEAAFVDKRAPRFTGA